ncbi:MAG: glycosyltransferase family 4 protein [Kovacikia sp.]
MRILHIANHIQKIGNGIVNVAMDLACLQAKDGHKVGVASLGGEYEALLEHYGIHHFFIDQSRTPRKLIQAIKRYQAIIEEFQPDIVHAHMMTGVILAKLLKGRQKYALVSTVHNEFQRSAIFMGLADRVIAVSNAVAQSMMQRGIPSVKLRVVRNGTLGSPRTRPLEDYTPMLLQHPAIATVAGMFRRKGIAELIEAFSQIAPEFPTAQLYLIGNGDDRALFEAQARQTVVSERIHFEGFQPEPQRYLLSTDIFVLASHKEPFGLVIPEAREAGCAIIASNVDGIPEALDGGKAGLLIPPRSSAALAEALKQLLRDAALLNDWKHQAHQNLDWLSVKRVNQETLMIYRELKPSRNSDALVMLS